LNSSDQSQADKGNWWFSNTTLSKQVKSDDAHILPVQEKILPQDTMRLPMPLHVDEYRYNNQ